MLKQPVVLLLACGQLSQAVGVDLQRAGYRVIAVRRNPPLESPLEWLSLDLTDARSLMQLPDEIELLIYTPSPSRQIPISYQVMYEQISHQLVEKYQGTPSLKRALLISSTRVYEERGGAWVDEDTPVFAASSQTQAIIDAENIWQQGFKTRACVLRLAGIYGPGREWQIHRLLAQQPIQYDPPMYTNRIHQQDAIRLISFLIRHPKTLPYQVFIGVDDDPVDDATLFRWLAAQLGLPMPISLPMQKNALQNKRCHNARIRSLGFDLEYSSFREGYPEMLASYRQH